MELIILGIFCILLITSVLLNIPLYYALFLGLLIPIGFLLNSGVSFLIGTSFGTVATIATIGATTSCLLCACYLYLIPICEVVRSFLTKSKKREQNQADEEDAKIRAQAREVLGRMTSLQKAQIVCGQPSQGSSEVIGNAALHVPGAAGETTGNLAELGISSMILADGPAGIRVLQRYEENPEDHSIYRMSAYQGLENRFFGKEFLHEGSIHHYQFCSAIPVGTLLAQTFDMELLTEVGELIGREMKEIDWQTKSQKGMQTHRNEEEEKTDEET